MKVSVLNLAKLSRQLGYLCFFLVAVTFSMPALAQEHGIDVSKVCPTASKVGDLATCLLGVQNTDDLGDDIGVVAFFDVIDPITPQNPTGANIRNPECPPGTPPVECNLPIVAITEVPGVVTVTCAPAPPGLDPALAPLGLVFPCTMVGAGALQDGGSGYGLVVESQYTVPVGSEDPLVDQGFVTVQDACNINPIGCNPGEQIQNFGAAVSLFVPSLDVTKTAAAIAKVGDEITYTIGFTNTSTGSQFPGFENCTGNDPLLGGDLGTFVSGVTRDFTYTVQASDPDPLLNTVTITCGVVGFDNIITNTDSHSVDVFAPSIEVTKTGPAQAKVGDEITYTIGFTDTSIDATLGTCTGNDPLLGGDLGIFVDGVTRDFPYTIQVGDADPLVNTATITCSVNQFDNVISDSDDHSMDLIAPSVDLAKACSPNPVFVDGTIEWAITVNNDGDTDLSCLVNDPTAGFVDQPVTVVAGGSDVLSASRIVGLADVPSISNTATVSCAIAGYDNEITDSATAECPVFETDIAVPMLSDGSRWLLILMLPGAGLLLLNRYGLRLRR